MSLFEILEPFFRLSIFVIIIKVLGFTRGPTCLQFLNCWKKMIILSLCPVVLYLFFWIWLTRVVFVFTCLFLCVCPCVLVWFGVCGCVVCVCACVFSSVRLLLMNVCLCAHSVIGREECSPSWIFTVSVWFSTYVCMCVSCFCFSSVCCDFVHVRTEILKPQLKFCCTVCVVTDWCDEHRSDIMCGSSHSAQRLKLRECEQMSSSCCTCRPPVVCVTDHTCLYNCATDDSTLEHPQFHALFAKNSWTYLKLFVGPILFCFVFLCVMSHSMCEQSVFVCTLLLWMCVCVCFRLCVCVSVCVCVCVSVCVCLCLCACLWVWCWSLWVCRGVFCVSCVCCCVGVSLCLSCVWCSACCECVCRVFAGCVASVCVFKLVWSWEWRVHVWVVWASCGCLCARFQLVCVSRHFPSFCFVFFLFFRDLFPWFSCSWLFFRHLSCFFMFVLLVFASFFRDFQCSSFFFFFVMFFFMRFVFHVFFSFFAWFVFHVFLGGVFSHVHFFVIFMFRDYSFFVVFFFGDLFFDFSCLVFWHFCCVMCFVIVFHVFWRDVSSFFVMFMFRDLFFLFLCVFV